MTQTVLIILIITNQSAMSKFAVAFELRLRLKDQMLNLARCKGKKSAPQFPYSASVVKTSCRGWNNKDFRNAVGRKVIKSLAFNKSQKHLAWSGLKQNAESLKG